MKMASTKYVVDNVTAGGGWIYLPDREICDSDSRSGGSHVRA